MRKKLLFIGLLVVGIALLSGCDLLDEIIDSITGGTPGGGTTTPGGITSVGISYHLDATISERAMPTYPVTTRAGSVVTVIEPKAGTYNPATRIFTATWDNQVGNYSNTYLEVRLNATEEYVEYYYMRQTQSNVWFAWTFVNEIRGYDILNLNHETDNPRIYQVQGTDAHVPIDLLTYKGWAREGEGYSASNPIEWINSHADIIPSINNVITITVYR
ncbi:hypothetical protein KAR02_11585 [Candidatus Bipolaricaulota bacterium]|nr:hypothetical protein [Candidatus Bipolaricaulota bacterium]